MRPVESPLFCCALSLNSLRSASLVEHPPKTRAALRADFDRYPGRGAVLKESEKDFLAQL